MTAAIAAADHRRTANYVVDVDAETADVAGGVGVVVDVVEIVAAVLLTLFYLLSSCLQS